MKNYLIINNSLCLNLFIDDENIFCLFIFREINKVLIK